MENIEPNVSPSGLFARFGLGDEVVNVLVHLLGEFAELAEGVRRDAIANSSFSRAGDKICDEVTNRLHVWNMTKLLEEFFAVSNQTITCRVL